MKDDTIIYVYARDGQPIVIVEGTITKEWHDKVLCKRDAHNFDDIEFTLKDDLK